MSTYSLGDSVTRKNNIMGWYSLVETGNWIEPAVEITMSLKAYSMHPLATYHTAGNFHQEKIFLLC